jgi:hypothetical protein
MSRSLGNALNLSSTDRADLQSVPTKLGKQNNSKQQKTEQICSVLLFYLTGYLSGFCEV